MKIDYHEMYSIKFDEEHAYQGQDLGMIYAPEKTDFRIWAPTAQEVELCLYETGSGGVRSEAIPMVKSQQGTFFLSLRGDYYGKYYNFYVKIHGKGNHVLDPYAKTVGVNGERARIMDLSETDPEGWREDQRPDLHSPCDAIIYELHVRDATIAHNSGVCHKGKYLGLAEEGTVNEEGLSTGLDHLVELGITHVQLLPIFDFMSIDESNMKELQYNWGYDPQNYNALEGSYATNPNEAQIRIKEFKTLVMKLHQKGIRVIMDVVYNHTGKSLDSDLNKTVPYYYYRTQGGKLTDASGCGNETASERAMFRKLMIDSVVFWAQEYHLDGFRFDLMGIHDIETMKAIRKALDHVDRSILMYGEGWTAGDSPLEEEVRAIKRNTEQMEGIGSFSDDLRDAIKGHVFENEAKGFVNGGEAELEESVRFGIAGACFHPQINYHKINYSKAPWAKTASQSINYAEAHDNLTLYDKLKITNPTDTEEEIAAMVKMSGALFLLAQGIPFLHAGMEFMRSKQGDHNSYRSSDEINRIDWSLKSRNQEVFRYYQGLIALRKMNPLFRMENQKEIQKHLHFLTTTTSKKGGIIAYQLKGDHRNSVVVLCNARREATSLHIPKGTWIVIGNQEGIELKGWMTITGDCVKIKELETLILVNQER